MYPYFKILLILFIIGSFETTARDYFKDKPDFIEKNLKQNKYSIDTSAVAIVLYEKYDYDLTSVNNIITYRVRKIIKILKKTGTHYADIDVQAFHAQHSFTKIRKLSGTTYNMENGAITQQSLDADNIQNDSYEHTKEKKFSMPSVREGSIIDYTFEIERPLTRNFCTWSVDGPVPKLYSEVEAIFPAQLIVLSLMQHMPEFQTNVDENNDTLLPDAYTSDLDEIHHLLDKRYVRRNITAISNEPYVYNVNNNDEQMFLYIKGVATGKQANDYSWDKLNEYLFSSPEFYKAITKKDRDVADKATELAGTATDDLVKAKKIYAYVRDSITVHKAQNILVKSYPGDVLNNKTGTITEINMLLIAMFRDAEIECSPVILSTRENGRVSDLFPDFNRFNYTICAAIINGKFYYLDASGRYNPFGVLPEKCYNGYARMINKQGTAVDISPDSAKETAFYTITTDNNQDTTYKITISCNFGNNTAMYHRQNWNADSAALKGFISKVLKNMPVEMQLNNYEVQNLHVADSPLVLNIHATVAWPADIKTIYFDPYLYNAFSKNAFTSEFRKYRVEMPCLYDITYNCHLQLPNGYRVEDSLPPAAVRLDESAIYQNAANYDKATNTLNAHSNLQIRKTDFSTDEYPGFKYFFDKMLEDQQKTLVIKRL